MNHRKSNDIANFTFRSVPVTVLVLIAIIIRIMTFDKQCATVRTSYCIVNIVCDNRLIGIGITIPMGYFVAYINL